MAEKSFATVPMSDGPIFGSHRQALRVRWGSPGFLTAFVACFSLVFGLVWVYVATMPMAFLDRDYPLYVAKRTMLDECRPGVAVFGDSRALAATVPGVMPTPVVNYAMSGTSPIETYFLVKRALDCRKPPSLVVVAHSALKFTSDSDYWKFSARSGFLSYRDMRVVDADAARLHDPEIDDIRRGDQLPLVVRDVLFALRFPAFYFDSLVHGWVAGRWLHNRQAFRDCLASSGHALFGRAAGSSDIAVEGEVPSFTVSPLVDLYFSKTLALLAHRGVPVVLAIMPVNQASYDRMKPDLKDGFASYVSLKASQFPSLRVINPTIPCWPNRYFGDAWHFNAEGADAYSRGLGSWLHDEMAGKPPARLQDRCLAMRDIAVVPEENLPY